MSLRAEAEAAFQLADYEEESALAQIDKLLPRARAAGDEAAMLLCQIVQSRICPTNEVEQSYRTLEAAIATAARLRDERLLGQAHCALAILSGCSGAVGAGLAHAIQAAEWARRAGDPRTEAQAESSIGTLYHLLNDFPAAIAHAQRGLALDEQAHDQLGQAIGLTNLAHSYVLAEQWEQARATLNRAHACIAPHLTAAGHVLYHRLYGRLCGYEAALALAQGEIAQAEAWVAAGQERNESDAAKRSGLVALRLQRTLGQIRRRQGRTDAAIELLIPLLASLKDNSPTAAVERRTMHRELYELYRAQGDFEQALHHYVQMATFREQQFNEQHIEQVRALQTLQEQARAQGVIAPLRERASALETVVQDLQSMVSGLRDLSERDSLTTLYNRRSAEEFMARQTAGLAVVLLDIDHFKQVNDRYGHAVGDAVLRRMGALLRAATPAGGLAARWGGEEFLLILPQMDVGAAVAWAEGLCQQVARQPWGEVAAGLAVTISLGVAAHDGTGAPDSAALLQAADAALYAAKHGGRNRVVAGAYGKWNG